MGGRFAVVLGLCAALCACATPEGMRLDVSGADAPATLRTAADRAEAELGVPADLVLAVSWVETGWRVGPTPADHQHASEAPHVPRTVGIGGLRPWLPGDPAGAAEAVLGVDREDIDADPVLGLLATAVALRQLAEDGGDVPPASDPAAWHAAVAAYSGIDHDEMRSAYVERVYRTLELGVQARTATGEEITLAARVVELPERVASRRSYHHAEYEGARWIPAREGHFEHGRGGNAVSHIIIHTMQGSYESAISWFREPSNPYLTSAHYLIRSSDGDITQMVHEDDTAHHIGGWNPFTIGIEHEGWVEDPGRWYTDTMYRASARLTRHLCDKYGVPIDREHIVGHVEVPGASHTDPGTGWDWERYMAYVREAGGPELPPFAASFVAQDHPESMVSGEKAVVWFELTNDGSRTWSLDTTRLGTASPADHPSPFYVADNWLAEDRATPPDHSTYGTGSVGRFTFEIVAPEVASETVLTETFQLVEEGAEWFGPELTMSIRVLPREGSSDHGSVAPEPGSDSTDAPEEAAPPGSASVRPVDPVMVSGGCSTVPGGHGPLGWVWPSILLLVLWRGRAR